MANTLLGRFGGPAAPQVSFDSAVAWGVDDLLVSDDDPLDVISEKMERCKQIVEKGGSLAVAIGSLPRTGEHLDYSKAALNEMTPNEKIQYEAWAGGLSLPDLNIDRDRENPKGGPSARTRDERRLAWLRRAYKNSNLTEHNLQYFQTHYATLIPLLCAGAKVIGQERAATNNQSRDARYLAEQVAAAKLAGAASARQNDIQAQVAKLNRDIALGIQTLQARKEAMKPEGGPGKKRKVPLNETRTAVGLPEIGDVSRWKKEGAMGRGQRLLTQATAGPSGSGAPPATSGGQEETEEPPRKTRRTGKAPQVVPEKSSRRGRGGKPVASTSRRAARVRTESPAYQPRSPSAAEQPPTPSAEETDSMNTEM